MITISFAKYHWDLTNSAKYTFRICYSDDLKVMLPHSHGEIELMYFYNTSECSYFCGGDNLLFNSRDMAVVNPEEIHACNRWGDGCQAICMIVDQRQLHTNSLSSLRFDNKITANDKIPRIMDDLLALLLSEACEYEKDCRINALMYTLLAEIIKYSSAKDAKIRINYDLSAVFDHIEQNLADKLTLGDLAEILHLSSDRFYHVFKEQTGISPTDYIISRRIEQSCSYLESTDMSISEIAQKCNFCTSSYFSKTFREYMGVTPKEYRKSSSVQLNIK